MSVYASMIRKEIRVYLVSPMFYVILTAMMVITGIVFAADMHYFGNYRLVASYRGTIDAMVMLTILISPFITMRLFAEEKEKGSIETMMTSPVTDMQVILSKFFAGLLLVVLMFLPTLSFLVLMNQYTSVDYGEVIGGYASLLLIAGSIFSIGLFISALFSHQMSAGVATLAVALLFIFMGMISDAIIVGKEETVMNTMMSGAKEALSYIDIRRRSANMKKGIVESRDIIFFLSVISYFLFLTSRALESRRWK